MRSAQEVADNTVKLVRMHYEHARSINQRRIYATLISIFLVAAMLRNIAHEYDEGFGLWTLIQSILAVVSIGLLVFYGGYDRYSEKVLAKTLAADIIVNLAAQSYKNTRNFVEVRENAILELAVEIARYRVNQFGKMRIKKGRGLPTFSPILEEYEFKPEDIKKLTQAMKMNKDQIEIYLVVIALLQASMDTRKLTWQEKLSRLKADWKGT